MKRFMSDANYDLDPFIFDDSEEFVEAFVDEFQRLTDEYEEEERKKKERAAAIARTAAALQSDVNSTIAARAAGNVNEDTAMADGLSLMQGSEAYEGYVRERMGMDQFELERAELSEIGFGTKGDLQAPGDDQDHADREQELSRQDTDRIEREFTVDGRRYIGRDRIRDKRLIKSAQAKDIEKMARVRSGRTASRHDDRFAEVVPEIMEHLVYDDGVASLDKDVDKTSRILDKLAQLEP